MWGTLRIEAAALGFLPARRQPAWLAGKRAMLQRVGPLVSALAVHDRGGALAMVARGMEAGTVAGPSAAHGVPAACAAGAGGGGCRLEHLLLTLQPGVAREVELEVHPSLPGAALEALPRLGRQLTALILETGQLPPGAAAALRRLPALRTLRLGAAHVDAACLDACAHMRHLTALELHATFFPLPALEPLAACPSLEALRLVDDSRRTEPLLLPPPASFRGGRGLLSLTVCSYSGFQARGRG